MPLAYVSVEMDWGSHIGLNPLTTLWACCVIGESVTFILMMGAIGASYTAQLLATLRLYAERATAASASVQCRRTGIRSLWRRSRMLT